MQNGSGIQADGRAESSLSVAIIQALATSRHLMKQFRRKYYHEGLKWRSAASQIRDSFDLNPGDLFWFQYISRVAPNVYVYMYMRLYRRNIILSYARARARESILIKIFFLEFFSKRAGYIRCCVRCDPAIYCPTLSAKYFFRMGIRRERGEGGGIRYGIKF